MVILIKEAEDLMNLLAEGGDLLVFMQLDGTWCLPCTIVGTKIKELANEHVILETNLNNNQRVYFVVDLTQLPFESIDDFISMPCSCLIARRAKHQKAVDAYPNNEDPFVTRDRVTRKERCNDDWRFYTFNLKYITDTYRDAEQWLRREMIGPLVEKESKATETQQMFSLNKKLPSANENDLSKIIDDSRKALPRSPIKRPAPSGPKKELDGNLLEDAAQSSSAVVNEIRYLVPTQEPAEKKRRLMKTKRNFSDVAEQNPSNSIDQTNAPNLRPQALSTTHNKSFLNRQQVNKRALVNENHINVNYNVHKKNKWMEEETPSPHQGISSVYNTVTYNDVISDHENNMSINNAPIEKTNNSYCNEIASESWYVDRPIAAQNFTSSNHQTYTYAVLKQILDHFATLFTQMTATLHYICDLYNNLQSSIAELKKQLLGAVEDFNISVSLLRNASPASNLIPELSQSPVERRIQVPPRTNSSNDNLHCNDVANKTPKKKNNNSCFVLPKEYDANDTRWTLMHLEKKHLLEELRPHTGIYVSAAKLRSCEKNSKNYRSLARTLLHLVFKKCALGVCLSMTEKKVSDNLDPNYGRPELDEHATTVMLTFVLEHARKRGWKTDLQSILRCLHGEIQRCRYKMVK